jgi:serine/threonine protein kinase/WD40 repeat protein
MTAQLSSAKEIFFQAIEIDSATRRAEFLAAACLGDSGRRAEVDALLAAHGDAGRFLGGDSPTVDRLAITERPGTQIGPYKLMEQIGEGGFGLVFVAEQHEPVRRKVALKVIKPGMDTREVVARFEAERQALAMMDHPHIAKVLDAGTTASGRPFFVMELVRGVPITEYCDAQQLTARQRLALFSDVCHAVQHAHQKGIIHRDLKPSNILVAPHDGVPVVKVIDFGISKALGQQLTDKTIYTRFAQMIGTPLYMSPEQAEINALDVDTRSDVYALGVLLYELLTGTTPFDKERLGKAAFDEIRRIIREEEPPRPSTRIQTLGATAATVSAHRNTEPGKLRQLLKNELDWIVMKALEKDRSRRYETAIGLARDVQRYLADQPVEACPPSTLYRASKFVRRNKLAFMTGSLIAASVLIGLVTSTIFAIDANRHRDQAQKYVAKLEDNAKKLEDYAKRLEDYAKKLEDKQKELEEALTDKTIQTEIAIAERRKADEQTRLAEGRTEELATEKSNVEKERDKAQRLADDLENSREEQRQLYYAAQMNLLQQAWDTDNITRARQLLQATRPGAGETDLRGFEWHYWQRKVHGDTKTIELQNRPAASAVLRQESSAVLSRDGSRAALLALEGDKFNLHVWDTQAGERLLFLPGVAKKGAASGNNLRTIGICHLSLDRVALVRIPENVTPPPRDERGYPHFLTELTVYDLATQEVVYSLNAFTQFATAIPFAFSHDGSRIAALEWPPGGYDSQSPPELRIWEGATGKLLTQLPPPANAHLPLALNHDGTRLAVATYEVSEPRTRSFRIQLVDLAANPPVPAQTIRLPSTNRSWALEFSARGDRLGAIITSSEGDLTRVYELPSGAEMCAIEAGARHHSQKGFDSFGLLRFSPAGHFIATAYPIDEATRGLRLYRAETGERVDALKGSATTALAVAMRNDPQELVCLDGAGEIRIWPAPQPSRPPGSRDAIRAVTADDRFRISAKSTEVRPPAPGILSWPRSLTVEDRKPPFQQHSIDLAGNLLKMRLSPDGKLVATVSIFIEGESEVLTLEVFEVSTGTRELVQCWPAMRNRPGQSANDNGSHAIPTTALAFSPDSQRVVCSVHTGRRNVGGTTATLSAWDLTRQSQVFETQIRQVNVIEFSPDAQQILCFLRLSQPNMPFELRSAATGEITTRGFGSPVSFGAGGSVVAYSRSQQGFVRSSTTFFLDSTDTGLNLKQFVIREGAPPTALAVSPDASMAAIAQGSDVLLIELKTGKERFVLPGHRGRVLSLAFSPDGRRLAASSGEASTATQRNPPLETILWDTETGQQWLTLAGGGVLQFNSKTLSANRAADLVHVPHTNIVNEYFWDASPPAPEIEARRAIEALSNLDKDGRVVTRAQSQEQIAADRLLSPSARQLVEEHIRTVERDILELAEEELQLLYTQNQSVEAYQRLLDIAQEALDHPGPFWPRKISELQALNIRGYALYRLERYDEALQSLDRAEEIRKAINAEADKEAMPILFQAMTRHRLGDVEEARTLLAEAQMLAKNSRSTEERAALLAEAQTLTEGETPTTEP